MSMSCFVNPGRSLDRAVERVRLAESLGYESVYTTHIAGRDSLTVLAAYALATERIRVGSGVIPIYNRTPAAMAQTAASLADLAGERVVLGLGVSHRVVVESWFGQTIDRPVAELKQYVAIVRAILAGEPPPAGEKWQTHFALRGIGPYPALPVYGAALSPAMLRAVGECCDGVMTWLCTPDYIRDVVVPEVRTGRERVGKGLDGFDIVAAVPAAVVEDRSEAYAAMRGELLTYFSLPFYRAMIERSGFDADIAAFDAAGGDAAAMGAAISDGFLDALTAIGSEDDLRAGVGRYLAAGAGSPAVGHVPGTDFDLALRAAAP